MSTAPVRHPGEFRWETRLLAVVTLILTAIGIASCYASGTYLPGVYRQAMQQSMAAILGGIVFLVVARVDYHIWRRVALPLLVLTVAALAAIAVVAVIWYGRPARGPLDTLFPAVGGAHRWIALGVRIQASEVARFTLVAWLAAAAAAAGAKVRDFQQGFLPMVGVLAAVIVLVAVEPSVSMAIALGLVGGTVMLVAGSRIPHLVAAAAIGVTACALILHFSTVRHHRAQQLATPALQCNIDEQACKSLVGYGNGGVFGVGYERGTQKFGHLPEAYSDFMLSVIGEEWGFVGVSVIALLYTVFCAVGFRIARTAGDPFGTYLASGLTVSVAIMALMHAAVVTRLGPTTGLTLPFISVGRVSLLLYLLSAGVLVAIGRRRGRPARA